MSEHVESNPTLSIINQRFNEGSSPLQRTDNYSVSALFEGGAMGSIVVAAEAATTCFLQRHKAFDRLSGTSSGGIIAMCVATGQADDMMKVFLEKVPSPKFINLRRVLRGNIADINYLVDEILAGDPCIEWEGVRDSEIPVNVIARSAVTKESVIFSDFNSREDVFGSLKAAAWMPRIAGWRPHVHNGHPYWDHMSNGLEVVAAQNPTHVIIFRGNDKKLKYPRSVLKSDVEIEEIRPSKTIRRLEKRQRVLKNAVKIGALTTLEAFEPTKEEIDLVTERFSYLGVDI
ncbi:patatin-like phospholipase family protein [Candidatus Saccharibacteria bacterium]|nr:patatin-like phospholipase family protein [Candidatus Saccharibacteria bacterium]